MGFVFEGNKINGNVQEGDSKLVSSLYYIPRVVPHGEPVVYVAGATPANVQAHPEPALGNVDS